MAISRNAYQSLVESVQEAVAPQNLVEWPLTINGRVANNAMELAQILNGMTGKPNNASGVSSASKGVAGAAPKSNLLSNRRTGSKAPAPKPSVKGVGASVGAASIAEDEQWDILDEILAEGLELYGEEGLTEILTSFAETGEMSQELADLLGAE